MSEGERPLEYLGDWLVPTRALIACLLVGAIAFGSLATVAAAGIPQALSSDVETGLEWAALTFWAVAFGIGALVCLAFGLAVFRQREYPAELHRLVPTLLILAVSAAVSVVALTIYQQSWALLGGLAPLGVFCACAWWVRSRTAAYAQAEAALQDPDSGD